MIYTSADLPFKEPKPFRGPPDKTVAYLISWFQAHAEDLLWHRQGADPALTYSQIQRGDAVVVTYLTSRIVPATFRGAVATTPGPGGIALRGMAGKARHLKNTPEGVALDRDPVLRIEVVGNLIEDAKGAMAALKSRR